MPALQPLDCHRFRSPDRTVFEKLAEILAFGCAYGRITGESCSATMTPSTLFHQGFPRHRSAGR